MFNSTQPHTALISSQLEDSRELNYQRKRAPSSGQTLKELSQFSPLVCSLKDREDRTETTTPLLVFLSNLPPDNISKTKYYFYIFNFTLQKSITLSY